MTPNFIAFPYFHFSSRHETRLHRRHGHPGHHRVVGLQASGRPLGLGGRGDDPQGRRHPEGRTPQARRRPPPLLRSVARDARNVATAATALWFFSPDVIAPPSTVFFTSLIHSQLIRIKKEAICRRSITHKSFRFSPSVGPLIMMPLFNKR